MSLCELDRSFIGEDSICNKLMCLTSSTSSFALSLCIGKRDKPSAFACFVVERYSIGTLRSDNGDGDGDGNVRSLSRAGPRRVGVPAKIEITNFTSENVDDGH